MKETIEIRVQSNCPPRLTACDGGGGGGGRGGRRGGRGGGSWYLLCRENRWVVKRNGNNNMFRH